MKISAVIKQSIIALKANRLRSIFSILGIVIGVTAVVIILSMGQSLKGLVLSEVESYGKNMLDIAIKVPGAGELGSLTSMAQGVKVTTLKRQDIKDLKNEQRFPYINAVSGQAFGQEWTNYQDKEKQVLIYGCSPDFPEVFRTAKLAQGRFFTDEEEEGLAKVAVLGHNLKEDLFGQEDPIGKKLKIKGQNYKIIGVFESMDMMSMGGIDINDFIYLPLKTTLKLVLGIDYLSEIILSVESPDYFPRAKAEVAQMLRKNHNISDPAKDDFTITTMEEILNQINDISVVLNLLLGFLAVISLVVGGVGIMNIMLVSVTERIREIGLRKSVGASKGDILNQFLIESLVITSLGGLIGVILGIAFSLLSAVIIRSQGIGGWPLTISWLAIGVAFGVSMLVGLIFGVYPARKAAQLDPINALRK